jgi:hypothetical protein
MSWTGYAVKKAVREEQWNHRRATRGDDMNGLYALAGLILFPALILYALVLYLAVAVRGIYRAFSRANATSTHVHAPQWRWLRTARFVGGVALYLLVAWACIDMAWTEPVGSDNVVSALVVFFGGWFYLRKAQKWARSR